MISVVIEGFKLASRQFRIDATTPASAQFKTVSNSEKLPILK